MSVIIDEALDEPLKVTFFPPLNLQRRSWVLNVLRREDVTSIVDIGCGEGELLGCLTQPAPWLRPPPKTISPHAPSKSTDDIANLHCVRVQGLDISASDLRYALQATVPPSENDQRYPRWEPLEAKIWQGGLESFNSEFVGVECIVSTEVIEHLPPDILPLYAPMMLGVYHPKRFLVTTPSYTFNARFTPPDVTERAGYPDPTGRTTRVFRHHDHKFEWTVAEFISWCECVAEDWGYKVVVGSVGRALEKDPWGRDEQCGGASQVAEFTRIEGEDLVHIRTIKSASLMKDALGHRHELLATYQHTAIANSQKPVSSPEIASAVVSKMQSWQDAQVRFEELWFEKHISVLCGGWVELLKDAIEADERLSLLQEDLGRRDQWQVELIGGVQKNLDLWLKGADAGADDGISGQWEEESESDDECDQAQGLVADDGDEFAATSSWGQGWVMHDANPETQASGWGAAANGWGDSCGSTAHDGQSGWGRWELESADATADCAISAQG